MIGLRSGGDEEQQGVAAVRSGWAALGLSSSRIEQYWGLAAAWLQG